MNKIRRVAFVVVAPIVVSVLTLVALASVSSAGTEATANQHAVLIWIDDFAPQPMPGQTFLPHNRLGGDRGPINGPGSGSVTWGRGQVTATITAGTNTYFGVWTSLNHPIRDHAPLSFSAIFPPQIQLQYQGTITELQFRVLDGAGTFDVELRAQNPTLPGGEIVKWTGSAPLSSGLQILQFSLPITLGEIQNLNWLVTGDAGDFVVVDQVNLLATLSQLPTPERAFLWSYGMLLANWDPDSGLTRDHAYWGAEEFDNVSASGMQAAAAIMAWKQGLISRDSATEIVTRTAETLLTLPRCHGLWPHFVTKGITSPVIISGTEWSSIDTVIASVTLLEAQQSLGLETAAVEQVLTTTFPAELILSDGSISHGYTTDTDACRQLRADGVETDSCACSQRIEGGWRDFGTESWLVNLGYAAGAGSTAVFTHTPPTFNGSGFIDELAWLLVPPPFRDGWETPWSDYRHQAAATQHDSYEDHACYRGPPRLFGLSAAEVPDLSIVPITQTYQPFGVGGVISPNDGTALLGHAVIIPHYAGMAAAISPTQASTMWDWLETKALFTPLNNVESFMAADEPTCGQIVWNALKGSWNLSLQTLGWGRLLAGGDHPLYQALWANDVLRRGYATMLAKVYLPIITKS